MIDAIAANYVLAILAPLKGIKDEISENSGHKTILDLVDLLKAKQAELDQAYEDIETFVQAHQRECDIKVQIANELKEKDKRIEQLQTKVDAVEHVLGCAMIGPKELFLYAERISKALRGEHE